MLFKAVDIDGCVGDLKMSDDSSKSKTLGDVYRCIYYDPQSTRNSIADELGLSLPTVTNYLNALMEDGLIHMAGSLDSTGGRKANVYNIVQTVRYAIGINISARHLSVVLIDLGVNIIDMARVRKNFEDSEEYYTTMAGMVETLLDTHNISRDLLLGVGIAMPTIFNSDQKTVYYAHVIRIDNNTFSRMASFIPYPILFCNDASAGGMAESRFFPRDKSMTYLSLCASVGGATLHNGEVMIGDFWRSSEFGHMRIHPDGKKCYCGQRGCLDAYCSEKILSSFTEENLGLFFEQLPRNPGFQFVFDEYLEHLALAVINLRMCYDLDIVIGGNVGSYMADHMDALRKKVIRLNPFEKNADFVKACHSKTEACAVGVAMHHINSFVNTIFQ